MAVDRSREGFGLGAVFWTIDAPRGELSDKDHSARNDPAHGASLKLNRVRGRSDAHTTEARENPDWILDLGLFARTLFGIKPSRSVDSSVLGRSPASHILKAIHRTSSRFSPMGRAVGA